MFNKDFFKLNRQRLSGFLADGAIAVITAAGQLQRGNDSPYPFHQDANFWYLTGINEPEALLVIDKNNEFLIMPETTIYQTIFDGTVHHSELSVISGIDNVLPYKVGWQKLKPKIHKSRHIATMLAPEPYLETYGMYVNPARAQLINELLSINPTIKLLDLRMPLAQMRMVKQKKEIEAIQAAINLTVGALEQVHNKLAKMTYEYEIEAEIIGHFLRSGADTAWKPIVASGKNATTLHHRTNSSPILSSNLLLADIGAEVSHYAADITRTYSINKKPTSRQKEVHAAVQKVQDYALSLLKPGIVIKDYEKQVESFMGERLQELGLIKKNKAKQVRQYFMHATSHFLGLEAHDAGDYSRPLQPGIILTVEPGIYIPKERLGVRIEDDVLITKDGNKVLSGRLSRSLT